MPTMDEYLKSGGYAKDAQAANNLNKSFSISSSGGGGTMNTMSSPQQQAQSGVKAPKITIPGYQNGQTVDLSKMYGEINANKPTQQWNLQDLQNKMAADPVNGQKVDLSGLQQSLGTKPKDTFTSDGLKTAIEGANTGASPVAVQASKYQDPAAFQQLLTQMNSVLAPLTQVQKGAAQTAYGQASNQLADRWAANGLLASGGAMAQQQQGANALAGQMSAIEAQQQANAVPLAQNFAQLGLAEDQQKFAQNANNRDFQQQKAQNNVGNQMNALGQQYGQQNAWMGQAQNLAGMDISQNQWSQQFGAQNKQNAVGNQLNAMGLQQNMLQDYLRNYMGATGMDVNQNQWSQQFGMQKQAQDFAQQAAKAGMNIDAQKFNANLGQTQSQQAQQNNQFNAGLGLDYYKTGQQNNQFNANLAQNQNQFDQKMGLDNKQANWQAYLQSVGLTGNMGDGPKSDWGNLMAGQQGNLTASQQNQLMDMMMKQANGLPFMPKDMSQYMGNMPNYGGMGQFLDSIGGQGSQKTWDTQQQMAKWEKEFAFDSSMKERSQALSETNSAQERNYKGYLMDKGISEDNAKKNTNSFLAQVLAQPDRQKAYDYLVSHDRDIADAGINISEVMKGLDSKFGDVRTPTTGAVKDNSATITNNAIKAAQNNPRFNAMTPAQQQAEVQRYLDYYNKQ